MPAAFEDAYYIHVDADAPAELAIEVAALTIKAGGLVAFPTETVYGLGANAWDEEAVERIFAAKSRPPTDPLIVHIHEIEQLYQIALNIPPIAEELHQRFWPGALTLVLKKRETIPDKLTAGLDTVAVRMPDHAVALALLREAEVPIAAPSANLFSKPSATTGQHVLDDLGDDVDVILDAGPAKIGVESTILSLVDGAPRILRPGGISREDLRQVLPDLQIETRFLAVSGEAAPAPGSMLRHYSPRARVLLFRGRDKAAVYRAMRAEAGKHKRVGVLARDGDASRLRWRRAKVARLGKTDEEAAARLFSAMRSLDQQGVDVILARAPEQAGLGLALWDRLLRAAVGEVVDV